MTDAQMTPRGDALPDGSSIVYIDGLNLHALALSGRAPYRKWADLTKLAQTLSPEHQVTAVRYFTADLHPRAAEDPQTRIRQRNYLKALQATGVEVNRGTFVIPTRWRTVSQNHSWSDRVKPDLPTALATQLTELEADTPRPWKVRVELPEEKFTDVALGVALIDDFHNQRCTCAVLVTNDADLVPAVRTATVQGHSVHVVSPAATVNKHLRHVASSVATLPVDIWDDHQLPDEFTVNGAKHSRPKLWRK